MDPATLALASAFGTAVVSAMATDAWQSTRARIVAIASRIRPDTADSLARTLEEQRISLLQIPEAEREQATNQLYVSWRSYFLDLLRSDPSGAQDLLATLIPGQQQDSRSIRQVGNSHDTSRIYIAANDQNFNGHA